MNQTLDLLICIGAGQAEHLEQWPAAKQTLLIDANAQTCEQLKQRFTNHSNITVAQHTVAAQTGEATWVALNMPKYSALSQPTGLFDLFPGLKVLAEKPVQTMGIVELLDSTITSEQQTIGLVLNTPDVAEGLLTAVLNSEWQNKLAYLAVATQTSAVYGNAANHETVLQHLQQHHYLLQWQNMDDADLPLTAFTINPLAKELLNAKKEIEELRVIIKGLELELNDRNQVELSPQNAIKEKRDKPKPHFSSEELNHQDEIASKMQEVINLLRTPGGPIIHHINKYRSDIITSLKNLDRRLYQQVESLYFLNRNLKIDLPPLRGWAMSPDALRFLYEKLSRKKPSVVVEFGSGASTLVIAKTLKKLKLNSCKFVSIEHRKESYFETQRLLEQNELTSLVDLRIAELVSVPFKSPNNTGEQIWYDTDIFADISSVDFCLIDGPPESTCSDARFPVVPALLDKLMPGAVLLLDDYNRETEVRIVALWSDFAEFVVENVKVDKGLAIIEYVGQLRARCDHD